MLHKTESQAARLTFFVLRSMCRAVPGTCYLLTLCRLRHPPFRGNAGTCCASLAEPGCLRCFDASHLADAPARRLMPPSALRVSTTIKLATFCKFQQRGPEALSQRFPGPKQFKVRFLAVTSSANVRKISRSPSFFVSS